MSITLTCQRGTDPINAGTRFLTGAGNVRSIMINKIEQGRVDGTYDMSATSFADYVDEIAFGGSYTENNVDRALAKSKLGTGTAFWFQIGAAGLTSRAMYRTIFSLTL